MAQKLREIGEAYLSIPMLQINYLRLKRVETSIHGKKRSIWDSLKPEKDVNLITF